MYKISDFAKKTGISKDTLRYYDHIGFFKPSYVDFFFWVSLLFRRPDFTDGYHPKIKRYWLFFRDYFPFFGNT